MTVLVIGGAGYIGSHTVDLLINKGYEVTVLDNLLTGHREAVHEEATLYIGDIRSLEDLNAVFSNKRIEAVFHFAAQSTVDESVKNPIQYYENNVYGTMNLLKTMESSHTKYLIFSSSAAVYGNAGKAPIPENAPLAPLNPYGETKLAMERMITWWAASSKSKYISLRYFNAAGAKSSGEIGEDHAIETHLIPIVLQTALGRRKKMYIYGEDYPTSDGTCIRDYIHVEDLADAHLLALTYLRNGGESNVFNLGNGSGFSVKEVIAEAEKVTHANIPITIAPKRAGDPICLVAAAEKAQKELLWIPKKSSLRQIINDAWKWHKYNPDGFKTIAKM